MLPATNTRVERNTPRHINQEMSERIDDSITHYGEYPQGIGERLLELDREWDIERTLEANAASIGLVGIFLGTTVDRRWLLLPAAVSGFLLQHALQGWCPPLPLFRRMGVRTAREIQRERSALEALRHTRPAAG
ncbi:MAG: hypothetical protein WD382_08080 [Halofilum sp. (in: g-proteobacteria)]